MKKELGADERFELVIRNSAEVVSLDELRKLLEKKNRPAAYCGYEPNGPMHLGHFVTILKLMDLQKAGFNVKILLADIHTLLNRKGNEKEIEEEVKAWKKTIKAIGIKAEIVLGSDFQFKREYQLDVMKLAQHSTINRGLRSMQEIARDIENATISQLWYPLMQVVDIKFLGVDIALGGLEQRKVHMIGKDMENILAHKFIAFHMPLITSLKGPGQKMSKSIEGSWISVVDSQDQIEKVIKGAYCPEKEVKENPILQICQFIIFPLVEKLKVERSAKFGGNLDIESYKELEDIYSKGKLHPLDLKNSVAYNLEKIIAPIRKNFK